MRLKPSPGRVFIVGPSHSFSGLADAINQAFARWDLAHLHEFELADGRRIDRSEHRCRVLADKVDPRQEWGEGRLPRQPGATWGWGEIPDQYGRRSAAELDLDP